MRLEGASSRDSSIAVSWNFGCHLVRRGLSVYQVPGLLGVADSDPGPVLSRRVRGRITGIAWVYRYGVRYSSRRCNLEGYLAGAHADHNFGILRFAAGGATRAGARKAVMLPDRVRLESARGGKTDIGLHPLDYVDRGCTRSKYFRDSECFQSTHVVIRNCAASEY